MPLQSWYARSDAQCGAPALRALTVSREDWHRISQDLAAAGGRLPLYGGAAINTRTAWFVPRSWLNKVDF